MLSTKKCPFILYQPRISFYILTPTYSSEDAKEKHKNIECQNWSLPNLGHFLVIFCSFHFWLFHFLFGCSTVGVLFHCLSLFTKLFVQPSLFVCCLFTHPNSWVNVNFFSDFSTSMSMKKKMKRAIPAKTWRDETKSHCHLKCKLI